MPSIRQLIARFISRRSAKQWAPARLRPISSWFQVSLRQAFTSPGATATPSTAMSNWTAGSETNAIHPLESYGSLDQVCSGGSDVLATILCRFRLGINGAWVMHLSPHQIKTVVAEPVVKCHSSRAGSQIAESALLRLVVSAGEGHGLGSQNETVKSFRGDFGSADFVPGAACEPALVDNLPYRPIRLLPHVVIQSIPLPDLSA